MIKVDASSFLKGLSRLESKHKAGLTLMGKIASDKMASDAKVHKPWTNRTGLAQRSIKGYVNWVNPTELHVGLSGGMEYSPYLEFANDKKYAILYPTLLKHKNNIIKEMTKLI